MNTNKLFLWLVCWLVPMGLASAQSLTATGIVRDAGQKTPLSGVAVVETGTTNGTISDAEGRFRLRVASPNSSLSFTYLGMQKLTLKVTSTPMDVVMSPDAEQLGEVVITALGISREKKALGYSVEQVGGAEIRASGESNMVSAMSAKAAGVQVTASSGAAGAASYIKIRGNASFSANDNQPLFVVDGVPIDNSQLNTED